jgi:hypothetical protein
LYFAKGKVYSGREIKAGGSPVKVTNQINFSSNQFNTDFLAGKIFSLKQSLVKYTPKNVTIFPV